SARRVNRQLSCKVAGDLFLTIEQQLFELADVAELSAVRQLAARIDWQRIMERELLSTLGDAFSRLAVSFGSIAVAPATHHVEVLQREAGRIDLRVTSIARFERAMLFQLLANCGRTANIRLDCGNAGRWRWGLLAEDTFHDPRAAQHGRGRRAICCHFEDRGLSEKSTAHAILRQCRSPERDSLDRWQTVVRC